MSGRRQHQNVLRFLNSHEGGASAESGESEAEYRLRLEVEAAIARTREL